MSIKKIFAVFTALATCVMLVAPVAPASAATTDELQAQINQLLSLIASLQAQLASQGGSTTGGTVPAACVGITFSRSLQQGASGNDVKCLQALLNLDVATQIAATGVGSAGSESTYFGGLTKAAVIKFQQKFAAEVLTPSGLVAGTGFVGNATRAKLNAMLTSGGGGNQGGGGTTGGALSVGLDATNPGAAYIADGSLYNPMLAVKLTAGSAGVTVSSITFNNGGSLISNTNVTGMSIWDGTNRVGNVITALGSDGKVTFTLNSSDLVIPAGGSKVITLKADISSSTNSGTLMFGINAATDVVLSGGGTVSGTFPVSGNRMSIADGSSSLGDVRISSVSMGGYSSADAQLAATAGNVEVGQVQFEVAKFQFVQNNAKEDIQVERLVVYFEGSLVEGKDLGNYKLYSPEGTEIAAATTMTDRYVTFVLATPYKIVKGLTKQLTVKADVLDGSTHYFRAQLQNSYDMMIKGVNTGAYVEPYNSAGAAYVAGTSGADANSYFRIKVGALTISKASDSLSGAVSASQTDIAIAKYNVKSNGEKVEVRKIGVYVKTASTASTRILSGSLKIQDSDTGVVYASVSADTSGLQNTTAISGALLVSINLSNYITVESNQTKNIEIRGNIPSGATSADTYQAAIGGFYVKRFSSNDYTYLPDQATSYYSANQLTTADVTLSVNKFNSFSGVRISKGANNVQIGDFVLGASAADDIKVSTIKIILTTTTGVQNVYLKDENGVQIGTQTVGSPTLTTGDTFTVNMTVPKASTKRVKVYANITSSVIATTTLYASIAASGISGYGVLTATTLSSTPSGQINSNNVTIGSATLTIQQYPDASTLGRLVLPDESGVTLNQIQFDAGFEELTLAGLTVKMYSASTSWTAVDMARNIKKLYLYDGTTLVASADVAVGSSTFTGMTVKLPADSSKVLTVKADIADVNAVYPKTVGGVDLYWLAAATSSDITVYSSTGLMTDLIDVTNSASSSNFLFTLAAPQITNASTYNGSVKTGNSNDEVGRFTITNPGKRAITLGTTTIAVAVSGLTGAASTSNFRLYDTSDTLLESDPLSFCSTTASTSANISFLSYTSSQVIAAGGSKTFVIKADTTNIRTGLTSGQSAYMTVKLGGSKGYLASDNNAGIELDENFWNRGPVSYSYTDVAGTSYTNLYATETINVDVNNSHALVY